MKEKVLFVDDDPCLIQGLQRMLRTLRNDWDMTFLSSSQDAAKLLQSEQFSILITDMRMPGLSGAELLEHALQKSPGTMRIVLSGQAELESILGSVCNAHQYLSKPCQGERLKHLLNFKSRLQQLISNQKLRNFISQITHLPCQTDNYESLLAEIHSADPSLTRIGNCIARDIGMTIRILQIANSALFNANTEVICPIHAVHMLGIKLIQDLVQKSKIFRTCRTTGCNSETGKSEVTLTAMNKHSVAVANLARRIACNERASIRDTTICSTSGLLHDIGKVVLMLFSPKEYTEMLLARPSQNSTEVDADGGGSEVVYVDDVEAERKLFGTTHSEVGAYLLGSWGLPDQIVEVAMDHTISDIDNIHNFSVAAAVRIANGLAQVLDTAAFNNLETEEDLEYYRRLLEQQLKSRPHL